MSDLEFVFRLANARSGDDRTIPTSHYVANRVGIDRGIRIGDVLEETGIIGVDKIIQIRPDSGTGSAQLMAGRADRLAIKKGLPRFPVTARYFGDLACASIRCAGLGKGNQEAPPRQCPLPRVAGCRE